ncbi:MAG: NTP transferase domain-containing protein [Proteobacteria bacterium]|jgi:mannose-1-phosphate guanylyltransferase|nr:NTP transferase domain-containing protein [Pseudomonadota bacterium]
MNVMLLCAGEGTRLRPYTLELPKPAIPFLGAPLMSYSISLCEGLKVDRWVINTFHLSYEIQDTVKDLRIHKKTSLFHEKNGLLGSGGGIHNAFSALKGQNDFIVMNGDEVLLPKSEGLLENALRYHRQQKNLATLITTSHPEVGSKFGGAWTQSGNKIELFSKTSPGTYYQGHHFVGVMILADRIEKYFKAAIVEENILYETLTAAIQAKEQVEVFPVDCLWFETGNPQDFVFAERTLAEMLVGSQKSFESEYLRFHLQKNSFRKCLIENQNEEHRMLLEEAWASLAY